jgi:hypothetical protein
MTKRTRFFLLGSVLFLVVGLAVGAVAYYGGIPSAFARGGIEELRYVPKDAAMVAYANVSELMNSDFRTRMKALEGSEAGEGRNELRDETGIDVERDIDYVVACFMPGAQTGPESGLVLAHGRFDRARIQSLIRSKGGREISYQGKTIFLGPERTGVEGEHMAREMGVAFLTDTVVALGGRAAIQQAMDLEHGGMNVTANEQLMKMIQGVEGGNAWAVGRFDVLASRARLPEQVSSQIPAITWFSASGHINGGLAGRFAVEARDEEAANNLRQVVNGFMALAKLQAGSKPEVSTMLKSIQLEGTGNTVAVSFTVPTEALDILGAARQGATVK